MSVKEFISKIQKGEIEIVQHVKDVLAECKRINKEYHYLTTISEELAKENSKNINKKGKLAGVAVSFKDAICVKGVETTASSKILKGYVPTFHSTVAKKVIDEGGIVIGKTVHDEFGFGAFSTNVGIGFDKPLNPFDKKRATGGSSGGAAGLAQKASFPHIAIGESTGGSIVFPSSCCGVFGLCPTYGRVSRYGLIDYGNSLDKIGPIGKTTYDVALLLEVVAGHDTNESTTIDKPVDKYTSFVGKDVKDMKVGIIKEAFEEGVDESVKKKVREAIKVLESKGVKTEEVSLKTTIEYGIPTYYLIATSEASTNLAKYCGMRYGAIDKLEGGFNEYFSETRSKNFGKEVKRRIILGTFARMAGYRDAYYIKAMKVRTKIINEYKALFKKYDALLSPTIPMIPPKFEDIDKMTPLQNYMADVLVVGPNLAGLPHLNVPIGFENRDGNDLPVGMLLTADHLNEGKLIQLGSLFDEKEVGSK